MTALEFFRQENITELPVQPIRIIRNHNFKLFTYDEFSKLTGDSLDDIINEYGEDGFSTITRGRYVIVYNKSRPSARIRWTLMHELSHIFLGHLEQCGGAVARSAKRDIYDMQADAFTADVLAPLPVLRKCGIRTAQSISTLTGLSKTAASIRLEELICADQFGQFYRNATTEEYAKHFSDYIEFVTSGEFAIIQSLTPPKWYYHGLGAPTKKRKRA